MSLELKKTSLSVSPRRMVQPKEDEISSVPRREPFKMKTPSLETKKSPPKGSLLDINNNTPGIDEEEEHGEGETPPAYPYPNHKPLEDSPTKNEAARKHIKHTRQKPQREILVDTKFGSDPEYAERKLGEWLRKPASQYVSFHGTHKEQNGDTEDDITDFFFRIPLEECIVDSTGSNPGMTIHVAENHERTYRGTTRRMTGPARQRNRRKVETGAPDVEAQKPTEIELPKPTLTEWVHRYCASYAYLKNFRINRTISGLDTSYIYRKVHDLATSIDYDGDIEIEFVMDNRETKIGAGNGYNRFHTEGWLRVLVKFLYILSFLWLIVIPFVYFSTKKWAIVKVDWPVMIRDGEGKKKYVGNTEQQWYDRWESTIKRALDQWECVTFCTPDTER